MHPADTFVVESHQRYHTNVSFDGFVRWLDLAHAIDKKAHLVSFDSTYHTQLTNVTTNLNVEEDLASKDLVFNWRLILKTEHVLFESLHLARATNRKAQLVLLDCRHLARSTNRKTKLVVFGL